MVSACRKIKVLLAQERAFALQRQLLLDPGQTYAPGEVARALVGLHAARLSSPWVAIRARIDNFQSAVLRGSLIEERSLLKLRCMRRTLHVMPLELAPIAHAATIDQRLGACRASLRRLGKTERALRSTAALVLDHLAGRVESYRNLEESVLVAARERGLVRLAIKWLWESGELVYLDLSPSLHHERRALARTADALPDVELSGMDVRDAQERLV